MYLQKYVVANKNLRDLSSREILLLFLVFSFCRINNCVGEDNLANFIQFLFYAALMSWSTLLMCLAYFLDWLPECAVCNSDVITSACNVLNMRYLQH